MRRRLDAALIAAALLAGAAPAGADTAAALVAGAESVRLPEGERLGLAHLMHLVEAAPGWWVGPALFGAAAGDRGGLFTWGVEGQRHWPLGERWRVAAGLYVGGGGGDSAPVGGGLMLRPHADLLLRSGGWSFGVSASQVRFPSGRIGSRQLGLVVAADDTFTPSARSFVRPERLLLSAGRYRSAPAGVGFLVLRAEQPVNDHLAGSIEAGAATSGSADGYAEFLAGLTATWPAHGAPWRVGARVAAGLGGGGAVPTGGGVVGKAALLGRAPLAAGVALELEAGHARALDGDLRTAYAALALAFECCRAPVDTEWSAGIQHYVDAQRRDGRRLPLEAIGLKQREAIGGPWYSTLQAWGAFSGGAGAYSAGLLGVGARTAAGDHGGWRAGAEMLVGAAGGGGVSSRGGAVVQPMLWADVAVAAHSRLQLGAGVLRSLRGALSTPVLELSWVVPLGQR